MDYLDVDAPIRGQKYVSLSFLCPEDILDDKNVFMFEQFLKGFSSQVTQLFDNLASKYPDDVPLIDTIRANNAELFNGEELQDKFRFFVKTNASSLEDAFHEKNDFRTTVRGVKVRGVYATKKEGEAHIMRLKTTDKNHNIWLGDVGAWLPFVDNPEAIENQTYANEQLNTLMKEYMVNKKNKDAHFQQRHEEIMSRTTTATKPEFEVMNGDDLWLKRKEGGETSDGPGPVCEVVEDAAGEE